jgi:hypothetical protein
MTHMAPVCAAEYDVIEEMCRMESVAANVTLNVFVLCSDWAKLIFNIRRMFTWDIKLYLFIVLKKYIHYGR